MTRKSILPLAVLAIVCSCEHENVNSFIPSDKLEIIVTETSFQLSSGESLAVLSLENDLSEAGVFAVKDGKVVEECSNIPVRLVQDEGNASFHAVPADDNVKFPSDAVYYMYYPYNEGFVSVGPGDDVECADFFRDIVSAWKVNDDQSELQSFCSSAFMYASSEESDGKLSFSLEHAMGVLGFDLPGICYKFSNSSPQIPDYVLTEQSQFSGTVPFDSGNGSYLYIFNPASDELPSGKYGDVEWSCQGDVCPGQQSTVVIGNGLETREHLLAVGDFFLSDGTLMSKDAPASEVAAAPVVGIVFQLDPSRIGDGEKEALGGVAHALVVSCKAAGDGATYKWFELDGGSSRDESEIGMKNCFDGEDAFLTYDMADNDIEGYNNNLLIRTKRQEDYANGCYPAFKAAEDFGTEAGELSASSTTGWYLPSNGQWFDILRNLGNVALDKENGFVDWGLGDFYWEGLGNLPAALDKVMEKVSDDRKTPYFMYSYHWTSTPTTAEGARYLDFYDDGTAFCNNLQKSHADPVRCVLAF